MQFAFLQRRSLDELLNPLLASDILNLNLIAEVTATHSFNSNINNYKCL